MADTRRHAAPPPAYPVDEDGDRLYTEDDYAAPVPDEWEGQGGYLPDEEPLKFAPMPYDDAFAPDADEPLADWGYEDELPLDDFAYAPLDLDDDDPLADDLLTDEEREELRRNHWQLWSSLADFAGIIVGTAAILLLIALLVSLLNWLMSDISQTFTLMQMRF